ncbi:helix-turn-helix domain-containing protein [Paraburkholderia sp. EG286B]|uniref:helix-turn-helix domain-containing protein n=1 Tax=Paraburkholderia sp. EG286B TaxID=3237011 RepID=UPI0034D3487D
MTRDREWFPRSDVQIARRLRDRREAVGLTQRELARNVGVAESTYVHWERGRLPGSVAEGMVRALEAALQVPQGWLLGQEVLPLPEPVFDAAKVQTCGSGCDGVPTRISRARCHELGPHARRLREELGLSVAEVTQASGVSRPTLLQWEGGTFPKTLTADRLRAWARALLLAPEQLLALPAPHPGVHDGRWCVVIEAETLEDAIHRVAQCLATRGRNLLRPGQPLDKTASRKADLLAHRYGIGAHRGPLVAVAVPYGMAATEVRKTVARMITRSAQFAFEIPVLDAIAEGEAFRQRPMPPMNNCVACWGRRCPWSVPRPSLARYCPAGSPVPIPAWARPAHSTPVKLVNTSLSGRLCEICGTPGQTVSRAGCKPDARTTRTTTDQWRCTETQPLPVRRTPRLRHLLPRKAVHAPATI